jgi:DNA-binding MarR family transcriptional regulator
MDAYTSLISADSHFGAAPVLIAGDGDAALQRAARTVEAIGARIGAAVPLENAAERIGLQASASAVWVELERDGGAVMDRLLDQVRGDVADGRYAAVVAAPSDILDLVFARVAGHGVEIVVDGSDSDRAAALAIATSGAHQVDRLSDMASDQNSARLRQLSDEVSRIASTHARLSTGPEAVSRTRPVAVSGEALQVAGEAVRAVIRARRLRSRYFEEDLFADPAWDMLLDLLQAEIAQLRVPVSSLCIAASVPATTALRWLKTMTDKGIFVRRADPHDGRRVFVELSRDASAAMRRYFVEVGPAAAV